MKKIMPNDSNKYTDAQPALKLMDTYIALSVHCGIHI